MFFTTLKGSVIAYETIGVAQDTAPLLVWGHGWGQSRKAFLPMTQSLPNYRHLLIDFPGFGESPAPREAWSVEDYAEAVVEFLASQKTGKLIWVGHSFGGRVGMRLAIGHPHLISGLFLIGSHGLKRSRGLWERIRIKGKITLFKTLKFLAPLTGQNLDDLRSRFGSADYKSAGALRPTFMKVIADDLTPDAPRIACPTQLVYGENDSETPVEMGQRLARLIPGAKLTILPGLDHYSVLGSGRHLVLKYLDAFLKSLT